MELTIISRVGSQTFYTQVPRTSGRDPVTVDLELLALEGVDESRTEYGVLDVVVYGYDLDGGRVAAPPHRAWLDSRDGSITGMTAAEALEMQLEAAGEDLRAALGDAGIDATSFEVIE